MTHVIGWRGDGKSLFLVKMIVNIQKHLPNYPVISNMTINCNEYTKLNLGKMPKLPDNILLCLDEIYAIINARLSMTHVNMFMGFVAFQLRKTNRHIFATMQQLRTMDVLWREEWDYKVYCARNPNEYEDWRLWDFLFEVHDKRKGTFTQWILPFTTAEKLFDLYDTNEIIKPRNWSRIEYEFLLNDPLALSDRSRDIAKKIEPKIRKTTKDEIEYALKRSGFDKIWKNDVYIELKYMNEQI